MLNYDAFADVDMVVEAVFEGMALKKTVFADLDRACRNGSDSGEQHVDAQYR